MVNIKKLENENMSNKILNRILGGKEEPEHTGHTYECARCPKGNKTAPLNAFKRRGRWLCHEHYRQETNDNRTL